MACDPQRGDGRFHEMDAHQGCEQKKNGGVEDAPAMLMDIVRVGDIGCAVLSDIDNLVDIGRVSGRKEAFHHAIKSWTESQIERYIIQRKKYFESIERQKKEKLVDDS